MISCDPVSNAKTLRKPEEPSSREDFTCSRLITWSTVIGAQGGPGGQNYILFNVSYLHGALNLLTKRQTSKTRAQQA